MDSGALARELGKDEADIRAALSVLASRGLVGFDVRAGATMTSERRTKAQVIDHALHELGIHVLPDLGDRVIMIGDRDHDVHGAMHHGIPCIGVSWGYGSIEELLRAGAVAIADSPAEVVDMVGQPYRLAGS